jgi:superfamily II DNA or RNA helicase
VLDEIHHAGTERAWGDAVGHAFELAARRLSLSGTPFRSDQNPIPFVDYDFDEAVAHYSYGYGEALRDGGVVRPVFFPRINGHMEWTAPDGTTMSATFDDHLDRTAASQRLRTALSPEGEWLPAVLSQAHQQLARLREEQPDAGGLVITMDVEHAHQVAQLLRQRHGVEAVVATSDDPLASERIAEFAAGTTPWIVAVRMVSEGVDVPRLRVGVYATNTVTELFFRQAVGRLVRWHGALRRQKAFFFIPDDHRLRTFAVQLAEQRTHSLKRREDDGEQPPVELDELPADAEDQLSLFQAISATPLEDAGDPDSVFDDAHPEDLIHEPGEIDLALEIELAPPPPLRGGGPGEVGTSTITVSRTQRKRELRQANADRVQMLVHLTGLDHKVVNAKLNDEAGIRAISEATVGDLERRLSRADRWIDRV